MIGQEESRLLRLDRGDIFLCEGPGRGCLTLVLIEWRRHIMSCHQSGGGSQEGLSWQDIFPTFCSVVLFLS